MEIIALLLKIFQEWPQRRAEGAKKAYASWRNNVDKKREDRARRAVLAESSKLLRNDKDKLP